MTVERKNTYTGIHALFAFLGIVLGIFYYRWVFLPCFTGNGRESCVFLFALMFVLYVSGFFKLTGKRITAECLFFMLLTAVYSFRFVLYDIGSVIDIITFFIIHISALLAIASVKEPVIDRIAGGIVRAVFAAPFQSFFALPASFSAVLKRRKNSLSEKQAENACMILLGISVSVPVILIVSSLLMSDVFFSGFMKDLADYVFSVKPDFKITSYFNLISALVSLVIFGAMYSAGKEERADYADLGVIPGSMFGAVMISVLFVYLLFFAAQLEGYLCMLTARLPENMTYAEFARSGFFQLCIAACINGFVIFAARVFSEKKSRLLPVLSVVLAVVTMLLVLTAGVKMAMYISAYGFTPKRFYTIWFMLLLGIIFSMVLVSFRKQNFRLSAFGVYVTAVMLIVLIFPDFEYISRWLNNMFGY